MAGYVGNVPVPQSVREDQSFTATAGQTTFNTLGYTDGTRIKVTLNGVLLEGGGVSNMAISASGVFTDSALENDIRTRAQKGQIDSYKIVFGDGDNIVGNFQITSYERAGEFNGEETYSLTLESSGQVTHTSA